MSEMRFWLIVLLLVVSGIGLRMLSHGEPYVLRRPLKTLPMQVEGWRAADLAFSKRIIEVAGVDEYLYREYNSGGVPLFLYIGYYQSQRTGDTIHSPKNCLPGSGWEPVYTGRTGIRAGDGRLLPVNLYVVQKGQDRQLVLYWYQSHGRVIASEYWAKIYMIEDAIRLNRTDGALVRITTPVLGNQDAQIAAVHFAEVLLPQLNEILPR
jgi:EpsI family protein